MRTCQKKNMQGIDELVRHNCNGSDNRLTTGALVHGVVCTEFWHYPMVPFVLWVISIILLSIRGFWQFRLWDFSHPTLVLLVPSFYYNCLYIPFTPCQFFPLSFLFCTVRVSLCLCCVTARLKLSQGVFYTDKPQFHHSAATPNPYCNFPHSQTDGGEPGSLSLPSNPPLPPLSLSHS